MHQNNYIIVNTCTTPGSYNDCEYFGRTVTCGDYQNKSGIYRGLQSKSGFQANTSVQSMSKSSWRRPRWQKSCTRAKIHTGCRACVRQHGQWQAQRPHRAQRPALAIVLERRKRNLMNLQKVLRHWKLLGNFAYELTGQPCF